MENAAKGDPTSTTASVAPRSVLELDPPPGIDARPLRQHVRLNRDTPDEPLERVIASLDRPAYLLPAGAPPHVNAQRTDTADLEAQRAYAAGRLALISGARFEARRQLERARRLAPDAPAVRFALGRLYASTGDAGTAAEHLRKAVMLDPLHTRALLLLGKTEKQSERWAHAASLFHAALDRAPRDPRADAALILVARYHLASCLARCDRTTAAADQLEAFLEARRSVPHLSDAVRELRMLDQRIARNLRTLGDLRLQLDQADRAADAYRSAAQRGSLDAALAARLLYAELLRGRVDAARRVALALFHKPEHRPAGGELLAYLTQQTGRAELLLSEVTDAYERSGRSTGAALALAELLPRDRAVAFLRDHVRHRPDDDTALRRWLRLVLGEAPSPQAAAEAARSLSGLLAVHPARSSDWTQALLEELSEASLLVEALGEDASESPQADDAARAALDGLHGIALFRAGQRDAARPLLTRALEALPELTAVRLALARLALAEGDEDAAQRLLADVGPESDPRAVAAKAALLAEGGRVDEALALVEDSDPDLSHPRLVALRVDLLQGPGNAQRVERLLFDALQKNPKEPRYYELLFALYDGPHAPATAAEGYRRAMRRMLREIPDSRIAQLKLAELHAAQNRFDLAEQRLTELLQADAGDAEALALLLRIYLRTDRGEAGAALIDRALERRSEDPGVLRLARDFFDKTGRDRRAAEMGIRLLEARPRDAEGDRRLAMLYLAAERYEDAASLIDRLLESDADKPENLYLAVALHRARGEEEALHRFTERLIRARFTGDERDRNLAALYLRTDRADRAVPLLEKLLERGAAEGGLHAAWLVRAHLQLDRPREAIEAAERGAERFPDRAAELSYLASLGHDELGDDRAAVAALRRAVEHDPAYGPANNALAYRWATRNRHLDEALELARRAVRADEDSAAYLDTLGWVHYKRGRFDLAVTWLERARRSDDGEYPVIVDHLGDALYRAGKGERAVRAWRQAGELLESKDWGDLDPELEGLGERVERKIRAAERGGEPATAIVPADESA